MADSPCPASKALDLARLNDPLCEKALDSEIPAQGSSGVVLTLSEGVSAPPTFQRTRSVHVPPASILRW
jgi:hypothetical protein